MFDLLGVFVGLIFQIIPLAIIVLVIVWLVNRNRSKSRLTNRKQGLNGTLAVEEDDPMKGMMLEQINEELEQSVRTDTTVVIVGMVINVILFGVNTGVAAASHQPEAGLAVKLIFFVLTAFLIVLNVSVGWALAKGKKKRVKITERLEKFWEDEGLGKYQDKSAGSGYSIRGNLFTFILLALGTVALLVSLIAYFIGF